jgi:hypothetical protein
MMRRGVDPSVNPPRAMLRGMVERPPAVDDDTGPVLSHTAKLIIGAISAYSLDQAIRPAPTARP